MQVRPYTSADLGPLTALFTASVHVLGASFYDAAQRLAWAPLPPDLELWQQRLSRLHTLVAHDAKQLAGFISYEDNGHIDLLYTEPSFQRRGVAALLVNSVVKLFPGVELFTEASLVAKPFFLRQGFQIVEEQHVPFQGITFQRFAMRKRAVVD
jgi:putative acetyltransferase